ncbi:MAG: hypothetical protein H7Y37_14470 [Anaerolineae bacterium]|nr:hypothetical protein [Gloeobacterales cyanobacterium ES-bin-313]
MKERQSGWIGKFVLGSTVGGGLLLALAVWNTWLLQRLASQPPPALVQLSDGRTLPAVSRPHYAREPAVIRRFVSEALQALFTWRRFIPGGVGQKDLQDPGIVLSNRATIPSSVFQAGFFLSEDLRTELLRQLAVLSNKALEGRTSQVIFTASFVGNPEAVAHQTNAWKVTVIGQQVVYAPSHLEGVALPFNKEIYVRAIDPPTMTSFPQTPIEQAVFQVRNSGLEIYAIRSLPKDQSPIS